MDYASICVMVEESVLVYIADLFQNQLHKVLSLCNEEMHIIMKGKYKQFDAKNLHQQMSTQTTTSNIKSLNRNRQWYMSMEFLVLVRDKHRQYGVAKQFNYIPAPPHDN